VDPIGLHPPPPLYKLKKENMMEESIFEILPFYGALCMYKTTIKYYVSTVIHNANAYKLHDMHIDSNDYRIYSTVNIN
jgi:hypothetical protein